MRILLACTAAALLVAPAASAQKWRKFNIFTGGEYSDKADGADRWRVTGNGNGPGLGVAASLYHAAEVSAKAGAPAFRVVKQKVITTTTTYRATREMSIRETAVVTVRAVRTPDDAALCEMPVASQCMTMGVAEVMARFGPQLGQPSKPAAALPQLAFDVPRVSFAARPVPRALPAYVPPAPVGASAPARVVVTPKRPAPALPPYVPPLQPAAPRP